MRIARVAEPEERVCHAEPADKASLFHEFEGSWSDGLRRTGKTVRNGNSLPPIELSSISAIGLNYRDHAAETGAPLSDYPVLFCKNPRAVASPGEPIRLPRHLRSDEADAEAGLAIILARECLNATRANAMDFVAGSTCANDVSARDWQRKRSGGQWCRGTSFDTFCPLGPWIVTPDDPPDPLHMGIEVSK